MPLTIINFEIRSASKTNNKAEKRFQKIIVQTREHYNLLQRDKLLKIHIPILYSVNKLYISSTFFLFSVIKEKCR
jgi:hypothetical protein